MSHPSISIINILSHRYDSNYNFNSSKNNSNNNSSISSSISSTTSRLLPAVLGTPPVTSSSASMAPPSVSAKGKGKDRQRAVTPAAIAPATSSNKRKAIPLDLSPSTAPPKKVATVFSDDREGWLVKRLLDPAVYEPLQVSRNNPSPTNVKRKPKSQVHRELADEYNLLQSGFTIKEKSIKNKIGNIQAAFATAHKLRSLSGFGSTPELDWTKAVEASYKYYFDLEPKWGFVWSNGVSMPAYSLCNLYDPVVTHGPSRMQVASRPDEDDEDLGDDNEWENVQEEVRGDAGETEEIPKSGGQSKKTQQQNDVRPVLKDIDGLGRYEIDARKAVQLRELELNQQKEMAEIEMLKAIKFAEINANKEVRLAQLEREKVAGLQQSQIQDLFRLVNKLVRKPPKNPPSSSSGTFRRIPPKSPFSSSLSTSGKRT
ncbi:MAG: hypothetical protein J3R72DRAFT_528525 [Linnemannia gamsii]|nr:MAG: hypothetical protein J3R72DRAFT_528525 [Linnemannia gamsii]